MIENGGPTFFIFLIIKKAVDESVQGDLFHAIHPNQKRELQLWLQQDILLYT